MDCSTPGFPVHHQLPNLLKLMSIESVMPSNYLILSCSLHLLPSIFPSIRVFSNESVLCQSIAVSASASVFSMNIQDWFPLGLTGWLPCSSRDSQESFPAPQFEGISSSALSFLYGPNLTSVHDYWKNQSFDYTDFCMQSKSLFFNMLSSFVIVFLLPRSKSLLISWLQLPSAVLLEPKKIKSLTVSIVSMPWRVVYLRAVKFVTRVISLFLKVTSGKMAMICFKRHLCVTCCPV